MGDFFDQWLRDDIEMPQHQATIEKLANATAQGLRIFLQHGNRDFMLDTAFFQATGVHYLADPHVLTLDNTRIILTHGDQLCSDDTAYQRMRRILRHPASKAFFRAMPASGLAWFASKLRQTSRKHKSNKSAVIMDTNATTVATAMRDCDVYIHGHTHRPKVHEEKQGNRYVLGDWQHQAMVLTYDQHEFNLCHSDVLLALKRAIS